MNEKNKGGRPKKEIDKKQFESLCAIQCTKDEICFFFDNIDEKTLTRWCKDTYGVGFSDIYKIKSVNGKISLRRYQFELAKRNAAMAIFLGKNLLGQRDSFPEETDKTDINNTILSIANLLNNPKRVRTEEDLKDE